MRQGAPLGLMAVLLVTAVAAAPAAYEASPPLARTGGFGEPTCAQCHFGGPENPSGVVSLGGVPERYRPGEAYPLELALVDADARVGGFQIAARVAEGPRAGQQAGTVCAVDGRVIVASDSATGVQYASHALAAPADSLRWRLEWSAPSSDVGPVVFHVVANAADDDDSPLGDAILTNTVVTQPKTSSDVSVSGPRGC